MKKTSLLVLALFFSISAFSQHLYQSSCTSKDSILKLYEKDAARLAVRYVHKNLLPYKDSLNVDKALQRRYRDALIAVYNATVFPARDTVIKVYDIHTNFTPGVNAIEVHASDTVYWMEDLFNNMPPTTNTTIAYYYTKYHMQYVYYQSQPTDKVVFSTDSNLNMVIMQQIFAGLPGVTSVNVIQPFSDARNIVDTLTSNSIQLTYDYGWGTCLDTCDHHKYWTFKTYTDCKIEYKGHSGEDLNTSIAKQIINENNLLIFPNPTSGKLTLRTNQFPTQAILRNNLGQQLRTIELTNKEELLDLSDLSSGMYFISTTAQGVQQSYKIIKE